VGSITFQIHEISFRISDRRKLKSCLKTIFSSEKIDFKKVNFIFCADEYLYSLNKRFLNHDTYTDILTFPFSSGGEPVVGEIYISVERVRENSIINSISFNNELQRVMIHGILHLCGYKDSTTSQKLTMRKKEDFYLSRPCFT
jgi:probable rRNA maturation factor